MSHPVDLTAYGWSEDVADAFSPYEDEGFIPARIARVDRGTRCEAVTASGTVRASTAPVAADGPPRAVCTGDWAALATGDSGEPEVRALLPRRTAFVRSAASFRSEGRVLAANVDHALIVVSLAAEPDLDRVEHLVSLGWKSGAQPLVVLTKADLVPSAETVARLVSDTGSAVPGVRVLTVSARGGAGVAELRYAVTAGSSVLVGEPGAGKSSLINALLGEGTEPPQTVRTVRGSEGRGRHTTARDLLPLPAHTGGGVLIDTPGLRGERGRRTVKQRGSPVRPVTEGGSEWGRGQ